MSDETILKFLDPANVDDVLVRGTVRISTLSYFRSLEGSPGIGDPDEATTIVDATGAVLTDKTEQGAFEPWRPEGHTGMIHTRTGGKVTMGAGVRFAYPHSDRFIFCASRERSKLIQAMCRDAEKPYAACVRLIVALDLFAHRLFWKGKVVEMDDKPVREFFSRVSSGSVSYDAVERHYSQGQAEQPSPFRKHPSFSHQSEVRVVLTPSKELSYNRLTVKLPRPERCFAEEFREIPDEETS
ncbi:MULTISPECIES: hypothetical protein [unclassified Bradyrhizobium]|uniref:hypothetical protein n=1 Tax=unclassified Bradyrhizobium TaxID=2631580 RepID=UPI0028E8E726|nr:MULTISPECIES: hypothetical protein [unclassified Bradyrhizobium]